MHPYYASEAYQRLVLVVRSGDHAETSRIIDEQVASTEGPEKAFWLTVRVGKWAKVPGGAAVNLAWEDLEEALQVAPDDPNTQQAALFGALGLAVQTESTERLVRVVQQLRPDLPRLKASWQYWFNLGTLHLLRARHKQAHNAYSQSINWFYRQGQEARASFPGAITSLHFWRALTAVACGMPDQAEADIAEGERLRVGVSEAAQPHVAAGLARAELALYRGRPQEARTHLQDALIKVRRDSSPTPPAWVLAAVDLAAARIAQAEGNEAGFRFFGERALTVAEQNGLPMSADLVRRVLAGADS